MYRTEYEANAQGFRCAPAHAFRYAHQVAYPVACRFQFKAALALAIAARLYSHFA